MDLINIRQAVENDMAPINDIVNYYVENTKVILDLNPITMEYRMNWFREHSGIHPIFVYEINGEVIGFGSLSKLYMKDGYKNSAEISIYVKNGLSKGGIGSKLLSTLINHAKNTNVITTLISRVVGGNDASTALHNKFGFEKVGTLKKVANKFDEFLDINFFQKIL